MNRRKRSRQRVKRARPRRNLPKAPRQPRLLRRRRLYQQRRKKLRPTIRPPKVPRPRRPRCHRPAKRLRNLLPRRLANRRPRRAKPPLATILPQHRHRLPRPRASHQPRHHRQQRLIPDDREYRNGSSQSFLATVEEASLLGAGCFGCAGGLYLLVERRQHALATADAGQRGDRQEKLRRSATRRQERPTPRISYSPKE